MFHSVYFTEYIFAIIYHILFIITYITCYAIRKAMNCPVTPLFKMDVGSKHK